MSGKASRGKLFRLLLTALVIATALVGSAAARPGAASREERARQIGAEAYVYGEALLRQQSVIANFPPNFLINVTHLSTPDQRLVPLPNVDTVYTVARLMLGAEPLVLHVPPAPDRYYTFQLLDAYTNTVANIGTRATGSGAGNFAIVGPGWHGTVPPGVKRIQVTTPTVWLLGRTLVKGAADLRAADVVQHKYTLTPLSRFGGAPLPAITVPHAALRPPSLPTGLAYFDEMGSLMQQNPPPRSERVLMRRFASVGIGPGMSPSKEQLDPATRRGLLAGLTVGREEVTRYSKSLRSTSERKHHGWLVLPKDTGNYGSNYLLRAYISQTALGANIPVESIYTFAYVDSELQPLTGSDRFVLHFAAGKLPPVRGFWSVTMYDKDLFLVTNPIARYAIGDRTKGLRHNRDGSLDILVQHNRPARGASNWLPAPAGTFAITLRLYVPKPSALNGNWPLPTITRVLRRRECGSPL